MDSTLSRFFRNNLAICFRVNNSSDVIQGCHFRGEFYEEEELRDVALVIPTGGHILDIGANVGNHLVYFGKFCRNVRITPFEVNPSTIPLLRENILLNNLSNRVDQSHLGFALGDSAGFVKITNESSIANNLGAASFRATKDDDGLPKIPLDDVRLESRPDFIKIDVEGMELEVLIGAQKTIAEHRPPIYIEVAPKNRQEFKGMMSEWGYSIDRTHQRHRGVVNYLCVPW